MWVWEGSTGRGAATSRGRTPRPGGSEPPSASGSRGGSKLPALPESRRAGGEESELRREEGVSEEKGSASGSVVRPCASIDANQDGVVCGGCRGAVAREHRVVKKLPCGHRHVMHARCLVKAMRRGGSHAQPIFGTRGCTGRHGRRGSLEAEVQADPGLHVTVAGLGRRPDTNRGERREELYYPWKQNS